MIRRTISTDCDDLCVGHKARKEQRIDKIKETKGKLLKRPSKLQVVCKWFLTSIIGLALLACAIFSKVAVIHLGNDLHLLDSNASKISDSHVTDGLQRSRRGQIFVMLQLIIFIPYAATFLRSGWAIKGRKDLPWPNVPAILLVSNRP